MSIDVEARQVRVSEVLATSESVAKDSATRALEPKGVEFYATADRAALRIEDSVRGGLTNLLCGLRFDVKKSEQGGYFVELTATRPMPSALRQPIARVLQAITPDVPVAVVFDNKRSSRR